MKKENLRLTKEIFKDFIIPLVVGISSVIVAVNANKIYQTQALIAKNAEAPTIVVKGHTYESKSEIEVYFLDGKFENPQIEIVTFLKCDVCDTLDTGWTVLKEFEFPIIGYYYACEYHDDKYGLVKTMINDDFFTYYENLQNDLETYYAERESQTLVTTIQSYLKINYQNLLGEQEETYYRVDAKNIPKEERINNKLGKEEFKKHERLDKKGKYVYPSENEETLLAKIYQWLKE